jgi:hypothetical protein
METTAPEHGRREASPALLALAVTWRSIWLSLLSFSPALLIALLWVLLRSPESTAAGDTSAAIQYDLSYQLIFNSVLIPFLETLFFQLLVIELLIKFKIEKTRYILLFAAIPFIGVHFTNPAGAVSGISVIPAGFILAYSYLYWRRKAGSWRIAFAATWLTHGLHNFYVWLLNFVPASLIFG